MDAELPQDRLHVLAARVECDAVTTLWERIRGLLSTYRSSWSLYDVRVRAGAAAALRPRLPKTGSLVRAADTGTPFVPGVSLLAEWDSV